MNRPCAGILRCKMPGGAARRPICDGAPVDLPTEVFSMTDQSKIRNFSIIAHIVGRNFA